MAFWPMGCVSAASLSFTLVLATPNAVTHATGSVLLRDRFVVGKLYHYRITDHVQRSTAEAGRTPVSEDTAATFRVTYRVRGVSSTGVADAIVDLDMETLRTTPNGRAIVLHGNPPNWHRESIDHLGPDNRLPDLKDSDVTPHSFGHYSYQTIGALPSTPVAPGQRWRSSASEYVGGFADYQTLLGSMPPVRIDAQNVFTGYRQAAGHPVAALTSTGSADNTWSVIAFAADGSGKRTRVRVHVSISISINSLFSLDLRGLQVSTEHLDARFSVMQPTATGMHFQEQGHVVHWITVAAM